LARGGFVTGRGAAGLSALKYLAGDNVSFRLGVGVNRDTTPALEKFKRDARSDPPAKAANAPHPRPVNVSGKASHTIRAYDIHFK
jgi:hypothetical protein